jgi:hypothetical protein
MEAKKAAFFMKALFAWPFLPMAFALVTFPISSAAPVVLFILFHVFGGGILWSVVGVILSVIANFRLGMTSKASRLALGINILALILSAGFNIWLKNQGGFHI